MNLTSLDTDIPRDVRRRETTRLFEEIAQAGVQERESLIEQVILVNTGLARTIARRYAGRGVAQDDLEQVAYAGLVSAARKFDGTKAEDFLTYAVPTIRGEIKRWFRDRGWVVRPPRRLQELQSAVTQHLESDTQSQSPSASTIARALGVDEQEVAEALTLPGCFTPTSLDRPATTSEGSAPLGELLGSYDDRLATLEVRLALEKAMECLTPRERLIIRLRFTEDMTQAEIGATIGITQMQVSRILKKVLTRLRQVLAEDQRAQAPAARQPSRTVTRSGARSAAASGTMSTTMRATSSSLVP